MNRLITKVVVIIFGICFKQLFVIIKLIPRPLCDMLIHAQA